MGRILNRLSYDTEVLDITMTEKATVSLVAMGWAVTGFIIMVTISKGAMLVFILPTALLLFRLQFYYRRSAWTSNASTR